MARVCIFDVNETLLDLRALDPVFEGIFGRAELRRAWFAQLLQSALVSTVTGPYVDFGRIGRAALEMVAAREGRPLPPTAGDEVMAAIRRLPPHPDAAPALARLRDAGFRLATLTNSVEAVAEEQLTNAGLAEFFEAILSADEARRLKPAPEPYRLAAARLGVPIGELRLVAAHAWDVVGALRAGAAAAFVARPAMVLDPLGPAPDVVGRDLLEVAEQIVAVELGR